MKMEGQVTAQINTETFSKKLPILVAPCNGPSLLGRDWISEINPNNHELFPLEQGRTPAEIKFGRKIRTKLTSLLPMNNETDLRKCNTPDRQLQIGQNVYFACIRIIKVIGILKKLKKNLET